jgi:hypothetical protein
MPILSIGTRSVILRYSIMRQPARWRRAQRRLLNIDISPTPLVKQRAMMETDKNRHIGHWMLHHTRSHRHQHY